MKSKQMLRAIFLPLFFLFVFQQAMAQERIIKGSVYDEKNNPLSGATVTVKGTSIGTAADSIGSFTLTVPASAKSLVISSVGYSDKEVSIGSKSLLSIILSSPSQTLNDVVIVGYGTSKKKDLTGSVSTVSSKDLNPGPVTNPLQQLY